MRQRRLLELIKDYDLGINYHPDKANVVVDAPSRKTTSNIAILITTQRHILRGLEKMKIKVRMHQSEDFLAALKVQPFLLDRIKEAQGRDPHLQSIKSRKQRSQLTSIFMKMDHYATNKEYVCPMIQS